MKAEIRSVDYAPGDLSQQAPFRVTLVRQLPGPDRPDYWLGQLEQPLTYREGERSSLIRWVVLASRLQGQAIVAGPGSVAVGIAYVLDEMQLELPHLDLAKCRYVAIGEAFIS